MKVKALIEEDFTNYKCPAFFIGTVSCDGKCCIDAGIPLEVCQNNRWRARTEVEIPDTVLCERYLNNPITQAIVFGGLEPFEQFDEMLHLIATLRKTYNCTDDVVIYTGYRKNEIQKEIDKLILYPNVIVKYGRYIPDRPRRYDETLGVELISDNQYAEKIS